MVTQRKEFEAELSVINGGLNRDKERREESRTLSVLSYQHFVDLVMMEVGIVW